MRFVPVVTRCHRHMGSTGSYNGACWELACRFASTDSSTSNSPSRRRLRLDVAIVGAPNAGKSQLLNQLTLSNVAAVSKKRHTTRDGVLGARTVKDTQLVFIDTPGFLRAKSARREGVLRDLMNSASKEMKAADYTLIVVDAAKKLTNDLKEALVALMLQAKYSEGRIEESMELTSSNDGNQSEDDEEESLEKFAIVLNKVDLVKPKERLLDTATELGDMADECILYRGQSEQDLEKQQQEETDLELLAEASPPIFYISALQNDGVDDVLKHLLNRATASKGWIVEPGEATDLTPQERVAEVIREKIYRCVHREVPYAVTQVNRTFRVQEGTDEKVMVIEQDLIVKTKSHKRLLLGKGGSTLKRIKSSAQRDIEAMFQCRAMLNLQVKWSKSKHDRQLDPEEGQIQREFIR